LKDEATLHWIESHLWFINLSPREEDYHVLSDTRIDEQGARALAFAANELWNAILKRDIQTFGHYFKASFEAQIAMFPNMVTNQVRETIEHYRHQALGWKISGAGGGGYLVLVSEKTIPNALQITIRR
jgi:hypothetical protein